MKFKSFLASHKALTKDIITSTCLVGASAGIVFGVSAGLFNINYMNLTDAEARLNASQSNGYYSEKINSAWNMNATDEMAGIEMPKWKDMKKAWETNNLDAIKWWKDVHGEDATPLWNEYANLGMDVAEDSDVEKLSDEQIKARYQYASMVIDGATHSTMDRSFNQSLYEGLVDFIKNKKCSSYDAETQSDPIQYNTCKSYKPSQDNTTDFINTYASVIREHRVVGLAGFNHSTPLTSMMTHKEIEGGLDPIASNSDAKINKDLNSSGLVLLDSNIANNQNIASIQFRADQPGFLTAIATCQYFYNNLDIYHDSFQDISVAMFGGVSIPTVMIYMGGFQRGIEFFNYAVLADSITKGCEYWCGDKQINGNVRAETLKNTFDNLVNHSKNKDDIISMRSKGAKAILDKYGTDLYDEYSIKIIKLGDLGAHFTGTFAAGDAVGITKQYLNRGASAIIAVAGPQSLDSAQEIQNQNSKCIVIGVDSAMEDGDYQRFHSGCDVTTKEETNEDDPFVDKTVDKDGNHSEQANAIIKFSAIKDIKNVSKKITRLCAQGQNWDVDIEPWNHDFKPDYTKDTYTLQKDDIGYTIVGDSATGQYLRINSVSKDLSNFKNLIVPAQINTGDGTYDVVEFAEEAFKGKINNIETLKLESERVILADKCFEITENSNIHCLDLSNLNTSTIPLSIFNNPFEGWGDAGEGKLIMNENNNTAFNAKILAVLRTNLSDWFMKKPDPKKSICGPGFQTCGNIQNGLISISWDGFYPLLQALMHIPFYDENHEVVDFDTIWTKSAEAYRDECNAKDIPLDYDYYNQVKVLANNLTFKRKDKSGKPTVLYSNYNHTIAILGQMLFSAEVDFDKTMTIVPKNPDDISEGYRTLADGEKATMSIIDWLDTNMYLLD